MTTASAPRSCSAAALVALLVPLALLALLASSLGCKGDDASDKPRRHHRAADDDDDDERSRDGGPNPISDFMACPFGLCGGGGDDDGTCTKLQRLMAETPYFDAGPPEPAIRECMTSMARLRSSDPRSYECTTRCIAGSTDLTSMSTCMTSCYKPPVPPTTGGARGE